MTAPERVVFGCTANSARSRLAAALWRRATDVPVALAGTHPGVRYVDRLVDDPQGQDATAHGIVADLDSRVRALLVDLVPDLRLPSSVVPRT